MFHVGYVTILGAPNVGKSTLLNQLVGEKLSIVTQKPQTTRHRILGILNRPQAQMLLLDTPGVHSSRSLMNEKMVEAALRTIPDADLVLHLMAPAREISSEDFTIAQRVKKSKKPYFVLINKVDTVSKESLLPLMEEVQRECAPEEIVPISALRREGLDLLLNLMEKRLPEGPALYPTDIYTERDTRFLCEEIVREKAMKLLHQEIPFGLVAQVEVFKEEAKIIRIHMALIVDRESHKKIVIGAKGSMLKKIGKSAREDIERMLGRKIYLELFVKVVEGWKGDPNRLKEFGIAE